MSKQLDIRIKGFVLFPSKKRQKWDSQDLRTREVQGRWRIVCFSIPSPLLFAYTFPGFNDTISTKDSLLGRPHISTQFTTNGNREQPMYRKWIKQLYDHQLEIQSTFYYSCHLVAGSKNKSMPNWLTKAQERKKPNLLELLKLI